MYFCYFIIFLCMSYDHMKTMLSHPKWDESSHNTACYGGKSTRHNCMDLRFGHVLQIGTNQQRRFSLKCTNTCKTIKKICSDFTFLLCRVICDSLLLSQSFSFKKSRKQASKCCKDEWGFIQNTCPTNMLPATLKVSVGEVPIVICITHEICVDKKK